MSRNIQQVFHPLKQFSKPPKISSYLFNRTYSSFRELSQDSIEDLIWNEGLCPNCWVYLMMNKLIEYFSKFDVDKYNKICLVCNFSTVINYDSFKYCK